MRTLSFCLLAGILVSAKSSVTHASEPEKPGGLTIAAASNLVYALDALNTKFEHQNPLLKVTAVMGASGSLVALINNGAPYDIFLSADASFSAALIKAGKADKKSLCTFAFGRLVLWSNRPGVDTHEIIALVRNPKIRKLALANIQTAPFGRAAKQALGKLGVWDEAQAKIVFGENITQTAQFVETGNVDAGFVALSLVVSANHNVAGQWAEVSADLYEPLEQCAVITEHGIKNEAAYRYLTYLHSPSARAILKSSG